MNVEVQGTGDACVASIFTIGTRIRIKDSNLIAILGAG